VDRVLDRLDAALVGHDDVAACDTRAELVRLVGAEQAARLEGSLHDDGPNGTAVASG
jgi:hypothetical protein